MSTAVRKIEPAPPPEMTVEEWADMPEDDPGELVDGQLVQEEVPDFDHEAIVAWLVVMIGGWILPRSGFVGLSGQKSGLSGQKSGLPGRKSGLHVHDPGLPGQKSGLPGQKSGLPGRKSGLHVHDP